MTERTLPPAVTIHGLPDARAALAPGRPVLLLSAPGAASFGGAGWWRALVRQATDGMADPPPDALDCADQPGRALEAIALGCRLLVLLPCPAWPAIAARAPGTRLLPARPPSLDLAHPGATRHLVAWLQDRVTPAPPSAKRRTP